MYSFVHDLNYYALFWIISVSNVAISAVALAIANYLRSKNATIGQTRQINLEY